MNRVESVDDLNDIRKALEKDGWEGVTLADCLRFQQNEWLDAIHSRLDKIEDRIIELKGDS